MLNYALKNQLVFSFYIFLKQKIEKYFLSKDNQLGNIKIITNMKNLKQKYNSKNDY